MLLSGYQCTKDCPTEGLYTRFQQNGASHTIYPAFNMSKLSGLRGLVVRRCVPEGVPSPGFDLCELKNA